VLNHISSSFKNLLKNKKILNQIKDKKPLCFIALPAYWFDMATAQAVWFLTRDNSFYVYHFGPKIFENNRYSYREIPQFNKNYLKATLTQAGVNIKTLNPNLLWFNEQENINKLSEININIPEKYLSQSPVFITWNYKKAQFKILNKKLC
jgi:hypothetical protein